MSGLEGTTMAELYISKCYCTNLRRSAGIVTDFYDVGLRGVGITVAQYYLLVNLSRLERANITRWAQRVGLERSTMVRNIKPLEARGLIELADGRGKTYALTPRGMAVLTQAGAIWEERQRSLEGILGREDYEAILRIGERLQTWKEKTDVSASDQ